MDVKVSTDRVTWRGEVTHAFRVRGILGTCDFGVTRDGGKILKSLRDRERDGERDIEKVSTVG